MTDPTALDSAWRAAHPLPDCGVASDKDARGRVLVAGGGRRVPGAIRLAGEAALQAGAGKLQLATTGTLAGPLGLHVPEAGIVALPEGHDGELSAESGAMLADALSGVDALAVGCGMFNGKEASAFIAKVLARPVDGMSLVLDAAALHCAAALCDAIRSFDGRIVMTPHYGELAALNGIDRDGVAAEPQAAAREAASRYNAVVIAKSADSWIATPRGELLHYRSEAPGLGTSGSGDVLAGAIAGLLARGAEPLVAAAWGVWLHGEAGKLAAAEIGPVGFLARDLARSFPKLLTRG